MILEMSNGFVWILWTWIWVVHEQDLYSYKRNPKYCHPNDVWAYMGHWDNVGPLETRMNLPKRGMPITKVKLMSC